MTDKFVRRDLWDPETELEITTAGLKPMCQKII